jgi:O-antigen/teichoic acid export membrane protein
MKSANKVVMNTGFLYGKIVITIFISLYATRLILNALGEVDFGIFNLIGGVIAMLSFINGSMVIATQRYLSISLGAGDMEKLKSVFKSSVVLHLVISLSIVVLLEIGGLFLFNGALDIPSERIGTARIIFHFMVLSTFFTINAVPYDASINTHENMLYDAILGIVESLAKLGIAICLIYTNVDKLILYGLLVASLTILLRVVKRAYCIRKYEESRISFRSGTDIALVKEMISFAGWNLFGYFCSVLKSQGLAILLNSFFGIIINAAYGVSNQVNSNVKLFSTNMIRAIMPQITKSEGGGDRQRMLRLSVLASKISFFLLAFFAIPIIMEMPFVLRMWLKSVPDNAIIFCQLTLVLSMMYQITIGTMSAVTSVGNIKSFQIAVGAIEIFNLPTAWLLMKFGLPAHFVFINSIFFEFIAGNMRIWYAHKIAGLKIYDFLVKTVMLSTLTVLISVVLAYLLKLLLPESLLRAVIVLAITSLSLAFFGRFIALTNEEYQKIKEVSTSILKGIRRKTHRIN